MKIKLQYDMDDDEDARDYEIVRHASGLRQCLRRASRFVDHQIRYTCGGNPARAGAYEEVRDELCRLFVFHGVDGLMDAIVDARDKLTPDQQEENLRSNLDMLEADGLTL